MSPCVSKNCSVDWMLDRRYVATEREEVGFTCELKEQSSFIAQNQLLLWRLCVKPFAQAISHRSLWTMSWQALRGRFFGDTTTHESKSVLNVTTANSQCWKLTIFFNTGRICWICTKIFFQKMKVRTLEVIIFDTALF